MKFEEEIFSSSQDNTQNILPLTLLMKNEVAYIEKIQCPSLLKNRLLDMGLTVGTYLQITRTAPLGDPIEIELRGYRIALRKNDAQNILVNRGENNR